MKKLVVLLTMMFITILSYGQWAKKNFTDEFGDPTGNSYIGQRCNGTFSNSATEGSDLTVDLVVYYLAPDNWLWMRFDLFEYNKKPAVDHNQFGILTSKIAIGSTCKNTIWRGMQVRLMRILSGKRPAYDQEDSASEILLDRLKTETESIKFHILTEDGSTYIFPVDPRGFAEALASLKN